MTWQEADLIAAWKWAATFVSPPFELTGVTYHRSEDPAKWVAFTYSEERSEFGAEGVGSTPIEALEDLVGELRRRQPRRDIYNSHPPTSSVGDETP